MYALGVIDGVLRGLMPRIGTEPVRYRHRVWPHYVDLNLHMNQAFYLRVMEYARWEWLTRQRLLVAIARKRMKVVVVEVEIKYRRELKPLQSFDVLTRCIALEGRAAIMQQLIVVGQDVYTLLRTKILATRDGKVLSRAEAEEFWRPTLEAEFKVESHRLIKL